MLTVKAFEVASSNQTVLCMSSWKAVMLARSCGGQPIFLKDLEKSASTDQVEEFSQVYENDEQ